MLCRISYWAELSQQTSKKDIYLYFALGIITIALSFSLCYKESSQFSKPERSVVDPNTGAVEGKLQSFTWYDEEGKIIKTQAPGEVKQSRTVYNSLGRVIKTDVALPDGTVYQQTEYVYDAVGHTIMTVSAERQLNQSGTGALLIDAAPQGRFHFTASWFDGAGREIASADYGTNGNEPLVAPLTVPARSDTVLLTETFYDSATGRAYKTIDPAGRESRTFVDALGRTVKTVANYVTGVPSAATPDCDVTVKYSYHSSGHVETMTVVNPITGNSGNTIFIRNSTDVHFADYISQRPVNSRNLSRFR